MRGEAIFHAGASLSERRFGHLELLTATAKGVGGESTLAQRETQNQTGRSAVYKGSGGVLIISIGANTNIPGDEVIDPRSDTESDIVPDSITGKMIKGVFPERTSPERVHGQLAQHIRNPQ